MKGLFSFILNAIVVALSIAAVFGHFLSPIWTIDLKIALTPEIADVLFPEKENPTDEEKTTAMLIDELAKENISLSAKLNFGAAEVINAAFSEDEKTETIVLAAVESIADSVNSEKLTEIENSLAKASVSTAVKTQVDKVATDLGKDSQTLMQEIGIDDEFIATNTDAILDSIREEGATVDSITETVMDVVDSVYEQFETSDYADQVGELSTEDRTVIEETVKAVLSVIADENGNVDGNDFISNFLASLLGGDDEGQASVGASGSALYASKKLSGGNSYFEELDPESSEKDLKQVLKEKLSQIVTPAVVGFFKKVFFAATVVLLFSSFWWLFLIVKIVLRLLTKKPYIKLKSAIMFGWIPFAILYIIPSALVWILADPASFVWGFIGGIFPALKTLISGVSITFATSAVISIICTVALFVFGIFYSICRATYKPDEEKK